ncbi:Mediator of DNA damage checkpoint protein 1 [Talaromyces islandicus]|uniref:Mediator of DNA damage checkpoint protein 1 n=1 Tax=Talaromyces islandicus TaxID=28573 RepID=A0A0U1M2F8_TALIS|nr:Mediator of DNA damage checkpoint protein 1 [Talaromyces islandicus]
MDAPSPTSTSNELRDDDDISLTSTAVSDSQDEYEVENIYAEERRYGIKTYLVKWKGYSDLRCTWEPASSFNGDECLKNWKKKEHAIKLGIEKPFDVAAWEARLEASEDAKDERKRRRREKRARLGLPPSKGTGQQPGASQKKSQPDQLGQTEQSEQQLEGADMEFSSSSDDDTPLVQAKDPQNKQRDPAPEKTSALTTQRRERPRIVVPEPVSITISDDRIKRRSLPHILHRAKEQRKSSADETPKTWKLFSTTNKFDKAARADHEPLQNQLELQKPGEWTPFQMSSYLRRQQSSANDSLFVEQDDDSDDVNIDGPSTQLLNSTAFEDNSPTGNDIQFNGCITAFDDTQAKLSKFANLLLEKDLVAIARILNKFYPQFSVTLLCFPAQSKSFNFLNRYSYEAPDGSLRIAGVTGLLPRVSQIRARRDAGNASKPGTSSRLERPERQGRFHESAYSRKDDLPSQRRLSQATSPVNRADIQPFSTISTPNPSKVRKTSKAPSPPSNLLSDKNTEKSSNPDTDDIVPNIPQKLQLNTSMATKTQTPGKPLSTDPESIEISPLTTTVSGRSVVNTRPKPAVQRLPSASSDLGGDERQVTAPTPPHSAKTARSSLDTRYTEPLSTTPDAIDTIDSTTDSLGSGNISRPATEAVTNEQPMNNAGDRPDMEMPDANPMENVNLDKYLKDAFPQAFKLDFNSIAAVTGYGRIKPTNCFYLHFPEEADADFQILEKYLDSHLAIVLSNRRTNDWERFTMSQSGVALFHHSFMHYYALPGLHRLTRNTSFNFWNVSLSRTIPGLDREVHFQRIFPNGAGFLMTEDFMLHEIDAAIIILAWFRENAKSKIPGSYRMMFRPDIMNWLNTMSDKDPRFTVMAVLIGDIACRGDASNWPTEPRDLDQFADPLLQSPAVSLQSMPELGHDSLENNSGLSDRTAQQRNGDLVCEIFSAWALLNVASMRRFCIITHDGPREPWRSWTHVEISRGPGEFYQKWGVNRDHYTKWLAQDTLKAPTAGILVVHCDDPGNDAADRLAKAAGGPNTTHPFCPPVSREKEAIRRQWEDEWKISSKGTHLRRIDTGLPATVDGKRVRRTGRPFPPAIY